MSLTMTPQAGHLDIDKMYQCLAVAYYWPNMFRDMVKYICICDICQRTRVEQANPWNNETQSQKLRGPLLLSDFMGSFSHSKSGSS